MRPEDKKYGIIDMGTNTFHLLIAQVDTEGNVDTVYNQKVAVKIGEGGISNGIISKEAQMRGLGALKAFREKIHEETVDQTEVYATSALRSASNSEDFLKMIVEETGFNPKVIDGDQEAEFIFYGVKSGMQLSESPNLIMDIGGGSVEFIMANNNQIFWKESFEIGAQRLKDRFHVEDPIPSEKLHSLYDFLDRKLGPLKNAIKQYDPEILIGVAGTFDTLSEIAEVRQLVEPSPSVSESNFVLDSFESIRSELTAKTLKQRINTPGLIEFRAGMIVVALALIHWVLKQHPFKGIRISKNSLKEGILFSMTKEKP